MARLDHHVHRDRPGDAEPWARIDALIAPGLRHAFPLPAADQDERFLRLLEALDRHRIATE